ncbi:MAG TPA: family 20 glycosylhydrolase, partial [Acidobacteriota bacterium]|nr:family 20 glycosylhydrolase [Acidobacteriota bacterium]
GTFRVAVAGFRESRIDRAVARFLQRLGQQTGIPFSNEAVSDPAQATLTIQCKAAGEPVQSMRADESYSLEVTRRSAQLSAPSPIGILRGLETVLQLVDLDDESFGLPVVRIDDHPRFVWRGLMIDVCRHWIPIEALKRNLDGMAAVKMNVFHWHLSEDQGFRIESKTFPKLQEMGSDGKYFTQDQVKEVLAYARDRGIRVVPEFDMPGHTTAWFVGYPELATAPGPYQIERDWGIFDPAMDPSKEKVYQFLDAFIGEMAKLFPDEYFHIGGDENNGKQWNASAGVQAFKKEHNIPDNHALQAYFNKRLLEILTKHGKKMIGWDEILHPDLPKSIIIQSWRGQASLAQAARQGFAGILSNGYYLDYMWTAARHYEADPLSKATANLNNEEKSRVLGGEACMWAEFVTPEDIDTRIWPRTAAIAERLWSPADVKDVKDMYRRLEAVSKDLDTIGLTHLSNRTRMLRRLAGDHPAGPVRILSDILEPVKEYNRPATQHYTSFTPLNRLVDATRPESKAARQFSLLVDQALAGGSGAKSNFQPLRDQLTRWRDNGARLDPIIADSFLLREAKSLSETVTAITGTGLQALDYLEAGKSAPEEWKKEQTSLLDRAKKPQAELLIMIVPALQKLVNAAAAAR